MVEECDDDGGVGGILENSIGNSAHCLGFFKDAQSAQSDAFWPHKPEIREAFWDVCAFCGFGVAQQCICNCCIYYEL